MTPQGEQQEQPHVADGVPELPAYPPRRPRVPARLLMMLAVGLSALLVERAIDLGYTLFGSGSGTNLGDVGAYQVGRDQSRSHVRMDGFLSPRFATYTQGGEAFEVRQFVGTGVLVSRTRRSAPPAPDVVERFSADGRLVWLDARESNLLTRLLHPSSRYAAVRRQFESFGELPAGADVYLLLDGDTPRGNPISLALTLGGLVSVALLLVLARRASLQAKAHREALRRLPAA